MADAVCLVLGDDGDSLELFVASRKPEWADAPLIAVDYDFLTRRDIAGTPLLAPMDVVPADLPNRIYQDYYAWQQALPSRRLADGRTVYEAVGAPGQDGGTEGWLLRVGNIMHVRMRFVAVIVAIVERYAPSQVCVLGFSKAQPWNMALLERVIAHRFPDITLVSPPEAVTPDAQRGLWVALTRSMEREREDREARLSASLRALGANEAWSDEEVVETLGSATRDDVPGVLTAMVTQRATLARTQAKLLETGARLVNTREALSHTREASAKLSKKLDETHEQLEQLKKNSQPERSTPVTLSTRARALLARLRR